MWSEGNDVAALPAILAEFQIATAGIGVIRSGRLAWAGDYSQQALGVPATPGTLFNVASITKTVTAETILRLVEAWAELHQQELRDDWNRLQHGRAPERSRIRLGVTLQHLPSAQA